MNKKKVVATAATLGVAAAVLLTGTYAYQSLNQEALNEASGIVNPGGRLHDDFNGKNKDVYVENFGDQQIFARIKISEYFEIGKEAGINLTSTDARNVQVITSGANYNDRDSWKVRDMTLDENATDEYWTMSVGGQTKYMPTFNKNKDSLEADINGTYDPNGDGILTDRYSDYKDWTLPENATLIGDEVYDADLDDIDQYGEGTGVLGTNYTLNESVEHKVATTLNTVDPEGFDKPIISYDDWNDLSDEAKVGPYWVQIEDWIYWAQPIEPGEATGLLINEIKPKEVFDDSWYYAIDVVGQFITADDHGYYDGTGFIKSNISDHYFPDLYEDEVNKQLKFLGTIGIEVPYNNSGYALKKIGEENPGVDAENNYYDVYFEQDNVLTVIDDETEERQEIKSMKLLSSVHPDTTFNEETFTLFVSKYDETVMYFFEIELADGTKFIDGIPIGNHESRMGAGIYAYDAETNSIALDEEGNYIGAENREYIHNGESVVLLLDDEIPKIGEYDKNDVTATVVIDEGNIDSSHYTFEKLDGIDGAFKFTHINHDDCTHKGNENMLKIKYTLNSNNLIVGDTTLHLGEYVEEDYGDGW